MAKFSRLLGGRVPEMRAQFKKEGGPILRRGSGYAGQVSQRVTRGMHSHDCHQSATTSIFLGRGHALRATEGNSREPPTPRVRSFWPFSYPGVANNGEGNQALLVRWICLQSR
jgi:hypothetical protein